MLKSYIKIAWRNISGHKVYTLINVTGLGFGICACLVIYLINSYDLSFDRFHPDGNRIYRIVGEASHGNNEKMFLNSPFKDVSGFQNQIPGFEAESGYHQYGAKTSIPFSGKPDKKFNGTLDDGGIASIITGPSYFDIFKYQWLAGDAVTLNEPFRVVITSSRALQYFGNLPWNKMIGKTVIYDDSLKVTVSGIIKDWEKNSDFAYTDFISISSATHSFLKNRIPTEDWSSLSPHQSQAFVKLSKGVSASQVNAAFGDYIKKNVRFNDPGSKLKMWLQPITDIHFTPEFHRGDDGDNQFRKAYLPTIYALMGAALFILLIAAINFINLSTAQSIRRAKETGIRKVLGSNRTNLILQFLTETFVLTVMAVCISVLLVRPVLSFFSDYIPNGVVFTLNAATFIFLIIVLLVTTLLAGFYPAIVLSAYLPAQSLKGVVKTSKEKWHLRKGLIVFQFSISLIFIIATLVIGNQIRYMRDSDKGFKTDAIVTIQRIWRDHSDKANGLAQSIKRIAGVEDVILEAFAPMGFPHMSGDIEYKGNDDIKFQVSYQPGNVGYIPFYEMKLLAGRNMFAGDSLKEIVVNQTFTKSMGFAKPEQAIGKSIICLGGKYFTIVGVVADFHENSFHESVKPVVIVHMPDQEKGIAMKLASKGIQVSDAKLILAQVEKQWKKVFPEEPFQCSFLNESIRWLYDQETKTAWLMNVVMIITIFISCMGLFGLAMFTAEQRTKEISIRKILGASATSIMTMLSKDFVVLVVISLFIASPVAWYFMNDWLNDFAYRIHISWWVFVLAGSIAVFIALLTVSFQAVKAAIVNPVTTLRSE